MSERQEETTDRSEDADQKEEEASIGASEEKETKHTGGTKDNVQDELKETQKQ